MAQSITLTTQSLRDGDVLVGDIYEDLRTLAQNDYDIQVKLEEKIDETNDDLSSKIDEVTSTVNDSVNGSINSISVTASTEKTKGVTGTGVSITGTVDSSSESGSGNITTITSTYTSQSAFSAGTYSLKTILQTLINSCHTHKTSRVTTTRKCNCNCYDNDGE